MDGRYLYEAIKIQVELARARQVHLKAELDTFQAKVKQAQRFLTNAKAHLETSPGV